MPSAFPELKPQDELRNSAPSPPDTTDMPPGAKDTSMWGCSLRLNSEEPGMLSTSHSHPCSLHSFIYSFPCLLLRTAYVPGIMPDLETQPGKSQDTCPQGEYSLTVETNRAWVSLKKARKFQIVASAAETISFPPGK